METTIIDRLYKDNRELIDYFVLQGEITYKNSVEDNFRKTLLLSAASYFESVMRDILISYFSETTNNSEVTIGFIRNKAIERQYHTYFNWRDANANTFFGLFGDGFKNFMKQEVKNNPNLEESIRAFLKLGNTRNELAHENFAIFPLESTTEEIYSLYQQASLFVEVLPAKLREYTGKSAGDNNIRA